MKVLDDPQHRLGPRDGSGPGSGRRKMVFDDQRPGWDSSTSDLERFKLIRKKSVREQRDIHQPSARGDVGRGEIVV